MLEANGCPVCRSEYGKITDTSDIGSIKHIDCPVCGTFCIASMAARSLFAEPIADHLLSAWIRWRNLHGVNDVRLTIENLESTRRGLPAYSVSERTIELLRSLSFLSKRPGATFKGNCDTDFPLAWATGPDELKFHLRALHDENLLILNLLDLDNNYSVTLTARGWEHVERGPAAVFDRGFVAMSFSDPMREAWDKGLRKGIQRAGYSAYRVDSDPHVQRIDQKIVADIRLSRFVVADVTEHKPGVYFEAGFALGLGKTVVWTVRKDDLDKVHFNTRQFAHVVWEDYDGLASQLADVILGVIGSGPQFGEASVDD